MRRQVQQRWSTSRADPNVRRAAAAKPWRPRWWRCGASIRRGEVASYGDACRIWRWPKCRQQVPASDCAPDTVAFIGSCAHALPALRADNAQRTLADGLQGTLSNPDREPLSPARCSTIWPFNWCSLTAGRSDRPDGEDGPPDIPFGQYGLPDQILCWGCGNPTNPYTSLTVWLLRLGVRIIHGRPYHPQTQGKKERFHRTLLAELIESQRTWRDLAHCAALFPRFRDCYKCERPHGASAREPHRSHFIVRSLPSTLPSISMPPT